MRTALIALSALALATGAQAKTTDQLVIPFADLNLATETGQKRLETRIEVAVRDFCQADYLATGTRLKSPAVSSCLKTTRAAAKRQMAAMVQRDTQLGG